jgi:hypothetical protein
MKKLNIYSLITPFLILSPGVFAHDPGMALTFMAAAILFYAIPIFFISFFSIKLIFHLFGIENKIIGFFLHWLVPLIFSIPSAIYFTYKLISNIELDIAKDTF